MHKEHIFDRGESYKNESQVLTSKIGLIYGPGENGQLLISYDNNEPIPARLVAGLDRFELSKPEYSGREVLLIFENGKPDAPVVTHLMSVPLEHLVSMEAPENQDKTSKTLSVNGKRIYVDAEDEIILTCGSASIMLKKDGKIIIKGEKIVSRAKGLNHIEGGATRVY